MTRIAALPMYDLAEMREANDAFWAEIASRLVARGLADVPVGLTRGVNLHGLWNDSRLLLSQTCGYPLATSLRGKVALVATPCYAAEGCDGPNGRSAIIVRAADRAAVLADVRGHVCAVNSPDSNSGMNLLRAAIAPLAGGKPFFASVKMTGGHSESARAVAEGEADVAAIDCVTWSLLNRHRPGLTKILRVLAWTKATAWLPFITADQGLETNCNTLRSCLRPNKDLLISNYIVLQTDQYDGVLSLRAYADRLGYPSLR